MTWGKIGGARFGLVERAHFNPDGLIDGVEQRRKARDGSLKPPKPAKDVREHPRKSKGPRGP